MFLIYIRHSALQVNGLAQRTASADHTTHESIPGNGLLKGGGSSGRGDQGMPNCSIHQNTQLLKCFEAFGLCRVVLTRLPSTIVVSQPAMALATLFVSGAYHGVCVEVGIVFWSTFFANCML